jgi:hypothetical protein
MVTDRKVHVREGSKTGPVVYDLMRDAGGRLVLDTGPGFVEGADLLPNGWVLCSGWAPPHAEGCARLTRRPYELPAACNCGRLPSGHPAEGT